MEWVKEHYCSDSEKDKAARLLIETYSEEGLLQRLIKNRKTEFLSHEEAQLHAEILHIASLLDEE